MKRGGISDPQARSGIMRGRLTAVAAIAVFVPVLSLLAGADSGRWASVTGAAWAATTGGLSAQALVEKDTVAVGEPFLFQIRIEGSDLAPGTDPPELSGMVEFAVEYLGGQSNNSSSITIVNGRMSKVETYGYVYSFRLTARKTGSLEIPAITVPLDSASTKTVRTRPIPIRVVPPEASDDFHLELKFSKTSFYVGEPVVLSVVWYLRKDVESVTFNVPFLQDEAFTFIDCRVDQDPRKQYFQLQVGGAGVLAEKGTGSYHGREYTTLSFRKVIFARKPGSFQTPEATAASKALAGYPGRQQRRNPFDGFFDDDLLSPGRRALYKTFVSRAEPVVLTVLPLPEEGKPPNFAGWVGRFQVEASASPTEVSVGDPITLTLSVSGSEYLDKVELPPLFRDAAIDRDFKVPEEMAAGVVRGTVKEFTQTLRPKTAEVRAVPTIKLPFFNPESGRYETAESNPIPLTVKTARILTSADVEGKSGESAVQKSELETWSQGIAHNYEGPEVLEGQVFRISVIVTSPAWLAVMVVPFLAFVSLLVYTGVRRRQTADPDRMRSRKAFMRFRKRVGELEAEGSQGSDSCGLLLDAVRVYLGDKLRLNGTALTFADIEERLAAAGIAGGLREQLRGLFTACEQGSYGGMGLHQPFEELVTEAMAVIRSLDRVV